MEYDNDKMKKFAKKGEIESKLDGKKVGFETLTNIEALQQGKFPEKLIEEFKTPESLPDKSLFAEIETKHSDILKGRPLPELLENSEMIQMINSFVKIKFKFPSRGSKNADGTLALRMNSCITI